MEFDLDETHEVTKRYVSIGFGACTGTIAEAKAECCGASPSLDVGCVSA